VLAFLAAFAVGSDSGARSGRQGVREHPPQRANAKRPGDAPAIRHARPGTSKIVRRHHAWQAEDRLFN